MLDFFVSSDTVLLCISSFVSALIGALAGSFLSIRASRHQERKRFLVEYYADFLTAYAECIPQITNYDQLRLLDVSIEKLKLFCPKEAVIPLEALYFAATNKKWEPEVCKRLMGEIQTIIENEINKKCRNFLHK